MSHGGTAEGEPRTLRTDSVRPLRVVFFNRSYHPETSATGQLLAELCESLATEPGLSVSVVTGTPLDHPGLEWRRLQMTALVERRGVNIMRARGTGFSKERLWGRFCNYVTYFLSACWAGLRTPRADVYVALTDPPIIGLAAWLAARVKRGVLIMAYKDIFPEVGRLLEEFDSPLVDRVLLTVNRFLARRADRVVALGETMRNHLIEQKGARPERTLVIPDWTDCRQVKPMPRRNQLSSERELDDYFVVMHSGNIGLSQGLDSLVRAAELLQDLEDLRVVFVGDGVKKKSLVDLTGRLELPNVLFLPYAPKARLAESLSSADLFVISLKKGLAGYIVPCKLYGILAAGRPFVAAVEEATEVSRVATRHGCGLVTRPGDPVALADAIRRLYNDPSDCREMGSRARMVAVDHFDRPRQVTAYRRLLQEAAV